MDAVDHRYDWKDGLQRSENGKVLSNLANALTAFRECPDLQAIVAYNALEQQIILCRAVPGSVDDYVSRGGKKPLKPFARRPLSDPDVIGLTEFLQRQMAAATGRENVASAIELIAREYRYDPLVDFLTGLRWDGVPRVDTWLKTHLGADSDDEGYLAAVGKMVLVSLVARALDPGCQADHMMILEGEQGTGKSSACRILGGEWFSDSLPDLSQAKDASQHLRGKWLIEIAELSAFNRAEAHQLKAFCTRRTERYRPPYGRLEVVEARRVIFIGSTNSSTYLRDETGNRRFWPVKTGAINLAGLAQDRDQLFAEAFALYRKGEPWWPNGDFEQEYIAPQQDARMVIDAWCDPIAEWLEGKNVVTQFDVLLLALGVPVGSMNPKATERVRQIMTSIGWVPCKAAIGSRRKQWKRAGHIY